MKKKKSYPTNKNVHLLGKVVKVDDELKTKLNSPQYLQHFLKMHTHEGDDILLVVTAKRPKRTDRQRNFMFVYLDLISLSCGHTVEELRQWATRTILSTGIVEVFGTKVRMATSESDLNISEFTEFINRIFDETEIPIPDPAPFNLPMTYDEYGKLRLEQRESYAKMKNRLTGKNINE